MENINSSITVMVPAYNEEKDLKNSVDEVGKVLKDMFNDYEILIFDDCSTDRTAEIADRLAKKNKKIRVIHNKTNMGLGYNHRQGIKIAKKDYFVGIPGDNEIEVEAIRSIFRHVGETDIIIPFISNKRVRSKLRRLISSSYIGLLNFIFGLNLRNYTGVIVTRTDLLRKVPMKTNSFAFQIESMLPLVLNGCSYVEVPINIKRTEGTNLLRPRNLIGVMTTVVRLFFQIHFGRNKNKIYK